MRTSPSPSARSTSFTKPARSRSRRASGAGIARQDCHGPGSAQGVFADPRYIAGRGRRREWDSGGTRVLHAAAGQAGAATRVRMEESAWRREIDGMTSAAGQLRVAAALAVGRATLVEAQPVSERVEGLAW